MMRSSCPGLLLLAFSVACFGSPAPEIAAAGAAIYAERCAACHDHARERIPPRIMISTVRSPEEVIGALTTGVMREQAKGLSAEDTKALAVYLTGREPEAEQPDLSANRCQAPGGPLRPGPADWNGWGRDERNTRFHPSSGLDADSVPRLKLKWAFAYPGRSVNGQAVVVGGRLFGGGSAGTVFSLDARTGCTHWSYRAAAGVRTAVVIGSTSRDRTEPLAAFFGGDRAMVYAVDAASGHELWSVRIDEHPIARVLGTPKLFRGMLYVPVSSNESTAAGSPNYPCCSFRGKVIALNPATGREIWRSEAITGAFQPGRIKENGDAILGPAGAAIFSSPTIDAERGVLYVGTGNAYTNHPETGSDAIHAFRLDNGHSDWSHQVLAGDVWIAGCLGKPPRGNCPSPLGVDYGFASSPVLVEREGRNPVLVVGSKSGILYALDPDRRGAPLWQTELARGNMNGAILWGSAVVGDRVFVATSEYDYLSGEGTGALAAVNVKNGRVIWRTPAPPRPCVWGNKRCAQAQVGAVTAIPGVAFAGSLDGRVRAYSSASGRILWEFDTSDSFAAVNGATATGGGIDYGGQTVANGMLFVHSGSGRQPGNALLAFSVDGQ